jgi:hypothetical protein
MAPSNISIKQLRSKKATPTLILDIAIIEAARMPKKKPAKVI